MLNRIILALGALCLLGFGILMLIAPAAVLVGLGIILDTPEALTEIRAFYGGLEIAIGLALAFCLVQPGMLRQGLALSSLCYGTVALARAGGMLVDGSGGAFLWSALTLESVLCLVSLWALRRSAPN
jgi:hypothetical protein